MHRKPLYILLALSALSLSGCATPASSPEQWKMEQGKGFDKDNFSINDYLKQHQECFAISQRIPVNLQKEGYMGCMNTRGYQYVTLTNKQIQLREKALAEHVKLHTPTESNYYHKDGFSDVSFVQDMKQCIRKSETIKRTPNAPFFSTSIIGLIAVHSISAMEKTSERDNKRQSYILNCMFDNGYVLKELSQDERQRRVNLIK